MQGRGSLWMVRAEGPDEDVECSAVKALRVSVIPQLSVQLSQVVEHNGHHRVFLPQRGRQNIARLLVEWLRGGIIAYIPRQVREARQVPGIVGMALAAGPAVDLKSLAEQLSGIRVATHCVVQSPQVG